MSLVNGKWQILTPQFWNFLTDHSETQTYEICLGGHAACQIWLRSNKGVSGANTQFVITFGLILCKFFTLCILRTASWPYRSTDYEAWWLVVCVSAKEVLGSWWWMPLSRGQNPQKQFWGTRMRILSQICKTFNWRYLRNLNSIETKFEHRLSVTKHTSWVVQNC